MNSGGLRAAARVAQRQPRASRALPRPHDGSAREHDERRGDGERAPSLDARRRREPDVQRLDSAAREQGEGEQREREVREADHSVQLRQHGEAAKRGLSEDRGERAREQAGRRRVAAPGAEREEPRGGGRQHYDARVDAMAELDARRALQRGNERALAQRPLQNAAGVAAPQPRPGHADPRAVGDEPQRQRGGGERGPSRPPQVRAMRFALLHRYGAPRPAASRGGAALPKQARRARLRLRPAALRVTAALPKRLRRAARRGRRGGASIRPRRGAIRRGRGRSPAEP